MYGNCIIVPSYSLPRPCKNILCPIYCHKLTMPSLREVNSSHLVSGLVTWLALANEMRVNVSYTCSEKKFWGLTCFLHLSFVLFPLPEEWRSPEEACYFWFWILKCKSLRKQSRATAKWETSLCGDSLSEWKLIDTLNTQGMAQTLS